MTLEKPVPKLQIYDLLDLLEWWESNLCGQQFIDPRGWEIRFSVERFPHFIKLLKESGRDVDRPQNEIEDIKKKIKSNGDYGGYQQERAATLSWLPQMIKRPTFIVENAGLFRGGDTLYIKEFDKQGYKYKVLVCRTIKEGLLVPVTSHPKEKAKFAKDKILWPKEEEPKNPPP